MGASNDDLLEIYRTQIRCVLELAVPVWQGSISQDEKADIERVQKSAFHIILGNEYLSYSNALKVLCLETLERRRNQLCLKFAKKCEKHEKFRHWFKINKNDNNTRSKKAKYSEVTARLSRFKRSPISFLTTMLNEHYKSK